MLMETHKTCKNSLAIMTGLAIAILVGSGIAGVQTVASLGTAPPVPISMSGIAPQGGVTTVYKDPNGPWPGGIRGPKSRFVEVQSGIFINSDKGIEI